MILQENATIHIASKPCYVDSFIGDGGQGEVYLVRYEGGQYALKMYKQEPSSSFLRNLRNNIENGAPDDNFLWPKTYVEAEGHKGYLMDLRPKNYSSFVAYLNGRTVFKDVRTMVLWCIRLCQAFKKLHEKGYSYQDLNDGSFFLDKDTGALLICDNDNVTADKTNLGILGKMRYMAPEIVRGETLPDTHSDRFSLAVILFLALCKGYPFEGERLKEYNFVDDEAENELFGTRPIYVYNAKDPSNRPIRGYHTAVLKRYPTLPTYIKDAFHKTFVDGLSDRENGRVTEIEWIRLLARYADELVTCHCGHQFIMGLEEPKRNDRCPDCGSRIPKIGILHIGKKMIVLEPGKELYRTHVDKYSSEYTEVVGEVVVNKKNPSLWGIRLHLDHDVLIKDATGKEVTISGTGVIPIVNNLKIKFSEDAIAEILVQN
ncbi:MAG: serine/threonine-protein kinase [Bacilli bacterium]|nr:serine/threonine-protein kinase [Bacilli bacterium]